MKKLLAISLSLFLHQAYAQTNISSTNLVAEKIMLGQYNPSTYKPSVVINQKAAIIQGLNAETSADSLKSYIIKLGTFYNRNTFSDTVSNTRGIGAARRWAYAKFQSISASHDNRLIPSYLQFDLGVCPNTGLTMNPHRNVIGVLPGADTTDKSIIIIEGHIDSRCENVCDTACLARGIEDNASGAALVLELARVMSKYQFKKTIVFMLTTGEEQGLYGGAAFVTYSQQKNVKIKCVLNNDVIGGILCGKTASLPTTCVNAGDIDSTHVRIFSAGTYTSPHKAFARFSKLEYVEELLSTVKTPMVINIMADRDRQYRGGDHEPFDAANITAVRFTASHEHGDASNGTGYTDRQHSTRDTLGVHKKQSPASVIDSFFVNFPYLQRNAIINGLAAAMASEGPKIPSFIYTNDSTGITLNVTSAPLYKQYKVSLRRNAGNYDLDRIYTFSNTGQYKVPGIKKDSTYYISLASMDSLGTESLFTIEQQIKAKTTVGISEMASVGNDIQFLLPKPNPTHNYTTFVVSAGTSTIIHSAYIRVIDITGRQLSYLPVQITPGVNEVEYNCTSLKAGNYQCSLIVNGEKVGSNRTLVVVH